MNGPLPEAVPRILAWDENHTSIEFVGSRRDCPVLWAFVVDIGAGTPQAGIAGQVDQHGELLDWNVDMRLKPKTIDVLAMFYSQPAIFEFRASYFLDR
jgi:hypothetical protein